MKKKKWERPKLIVITKGDRQEGVLNSCKGNSTTTASDAVHDGCSFPNTAEYRCNYRCSSDDVS